MGWPEAALPPVPFSALALSFFAVSAAAYAHKGDCRTAFLQRLQKQKECGAEQQEP